MLIPQEEIDKSEGDWGQYGELTGEALLSLIRENKLSVLFGNKSIIVGVQRPDGATGTYQLPHIDDIANF